jgi:hypothetical protein
MPAGRRPPFTVLLAVLVYVVIGSLILLLAAIVGGGVITWDVKGFLLTGWRLALFSSALGAVGSVAVVAALGLWSARAWARPLALGFWVAAGALGLITDRSVAGEGAPLRSYLVEIALIPATTSAVFLYAVPGVRRHFAEARPK